MFIMLLFFPFIFFPNSLDNIAGALRLIDKCFSQLLELKFSSLSFSKIDALFIKQSKYFSFDFANFTILFKSFSFPKSPLTR